MTAERVRTGFLDKVYQGRDGSKARYVVFIPPHYDGKKPFPLILFLPWFLTQICVSYAHDQSPKVPLASIVQHSGETHHDESERLYAQFLKRFDGRTPYPALGVEESLHAMALAEREDLRTWPRMLGKPAPVIEGEDLDGRPMKLSEFRGKVVLLSFWLVLVLVIGIVAAGAGAVAHRLQAAKQTTKPKRSPMRRRRPGPRGGGCQIAPTPTATRCRKGQWHAWERCDFTTPTRTTRSPTLRTVRPSFQRAGTT
jgi:hypothetical protein